MLARSSLEIAATGDCLNRAGYISASLEYYDSALKNFQSEILSITPEKEQAVLVFSLITVILGFTLPQLTSSKDESQKMVKIMVAHFGLLQGVGTITIQYWTTVRQGPILRNVPAEDSQTGKLEADIEPPITRLNELNEARNNVATDQSKAAKLQTITYHAACRKPIFHLEDLFSRCGHPYERGCALAWLNLAGKDFVTAVENADSVALLATDALGSPG